MNHNHFKNCHNEAYIFISKLTSNMRILHSPVLPACEIFRRRPKGGERERVAENLVSPLAARMHRFSGPDDRFPGKISIETLHMDFIDRFANFLDTESARDESRRRLSGEYGRDSTAQLAVIDSSQTRRIFATTIRRADSQPSNGNRSRRWNIKNNRRKLVAFSGSKSFQFISVRF